MSAPYAHQEIVRQYFDFTAGYWRDVYADDTLAGRIYQQRLTAALRWIDELHLARGTKVLDAGCGAGVATVALAERGYHVDAIDLAPAMLELTAGFAKTNGVGHRVQTQLSAATKLPFSSGTFECVVALGLLPWVERPEAEIAELARVLKPGGYLLVSIDNYWRSEQFLDPVTNPFCGPLRQIVGNALRALRRQPGSAHPVAHNHRPAKIEALTRRIGLEPVKNATFGFGPYSFVKRSLFAEQTSMKLHDRLQKAADAGSWPWKHCGCQCLQLSRKL